MAKIRTQLSEAPAKIHDLYWEFEGIYESLDDLCGPIPEDFDPVIIIEDQDIVTILKAHGIDDPVTPGLTYQPHYEDQFWTKDGLAERYAQCMRNGDEFPPIVMCGMSIVGGRHRFKASILNERKTISAVNVDLIKPQLAKAQKEAGIKTRLEAMKGSRVR